MVEFATVYAPYKGLFNQILPAHVITDPTCMDVSGDFLDAIPVSARPWQLDVMEPGSGDPRSEPGLLGRRRSGGVSDCHGPENR